ncbi:MAG TPA: dienelactone hydrolase family protein [Chloroflexia bacterium]|nr:dienelactone hydrolase family protein [Chloroflexia bacterium]
MCYDDKARPPMPPTNGGQAQGQDLVLTAADGNQFAAFLAQPESPAGAQILIYPDVRGLHGFYKDLALRFAETGVRALAIDYFGRTAGLAPRDDSFEFMPHVQQLSISNIFADAQAALDYLREGADRPAFVVGFCIGGSLTLLTAGQDLGLAGVIAFYAGMSRDFGGYGTALDRATQVKYPVLGLFGGADPGIPPEQVAELDSRLDQAGVPHDIVTYPDAPHSFFDRKATDYAAASADAWRRMLSFIETYSRTST